jgi:hypothetical protein
MAGVGAAGVIDTLSSDFGQGSGSGDLDAIVV